MPPKKKKTAKSKTTKKKTEGLSGKDLTGFLSARKIALETKYGKDR